MITPTSQEGRWLLFLSIIVLTVLLTILVHQDRSNRQEVMKTFMTITPQDIIAFKIRPDTSSSYSDSNVVELKTKDESSVTAFFQAITDNRPYYPEHDRGSTGWGIQIHTEALIMTCRFYIPVDKPGIVVGNIRTAASVSATFQSSSLLRWYQKYGHYWQIGGYQKVQYGRVKSILKSILSEEIISFKIASDGSEAFERKYTSEFSREAQLVAEFVQTLEDMQFAASIQKKFITQWGVQIDTSATTVKLECSIPVDDPTLVIGLIDSHEGYTYFQSQKLFQWYQKYKDRWLKPDGKEGSEEGEKKSREEEQTLRS